MGNVLKEQLTSNKKINKEKELIELNPALLWEILRGAGVSEFSQIVLKVNIEIQSKQYTCFQDSC